MPFEPNNAYGKKTKRGKNKTTKELREVSAMILGGELDNLKDRLPNLCDSDYIRAIGMLMKNVLPAQKQVEMELQSSNDEYQEEFISKLDKLTDSQAHDFVVGLADEASRKLKEKRDVENNK